ncbi:MAG: PepSY-associated TM helix domain-containing protein [Pseudomonadota bacterium]
MAGAAAAASGYNRVNRRVAFVRWVRRTHGWFGLWGALLGLMMGVSGVWLNHRAVLKLPLPDQHRSDGRLTLPEPRPATVDAMAAWLQRSLKADRPAVNVRIERARPAPWAERNGEGMPPMQPERWTFVFGGPNKVMQVEYWAGNRTASVRTTENGFVATLTNLHKGATMPVPWILLIDTMAGALIFLSVSGAILWWETHRRRVAGIVIFGLSVVITVGLAMLPLQW